MAMKNTTLVAFAAATAALGASPVTTSFRTSGTTDLWVTIRNNSPQSVRLHLVEFRSTAGTWIYATPDPRTDDPHYWIAPGETREQHTYVPSRHREYQIHIGRIAVRYADGTTEGDLELLRQVEGSQRRERPGDTPGPACWITAQYAWAYQNAIQIPGTLTGLGYSVSASLTSNGQPNLLEARNQGWNEGKCSSDGMHHSMDLDMPIVDGCPAYQQTVAVYAFYAASGFYLVELDVNGTITPLIWPNQQPKMSWKASAVAPIVTGSFGGPCH